MTGAEEKVVQSRKLRRELLLALLLVIVASEIQFFAMLIFPSLFFGKGIVITLGVMPIILVTLYELFRKKYVKLNIGD